MVVRTGQGCVGPCLGKRPMGRPWAVASAPDDAWPILDGNCVLGLTCDLRTRRHTPQTLK